MKINFLKFLRRYQIFSKSSKFNLKLYRKILTDKRTPKSSKFFLWLAIAYMLTPFDLVPDFIPILGQLDDIIILILLISMAQKRIPEDLLEQLKSENA